MKKIKVIFTGGTIGSLAQGNNINTNAQTQYMLLEKYGKDLERFDCIAPLSILSENANLGNVLIMAKEILHAQKEDIAGIILTHGTDTLAYSASLISFLLPNLKVPVVLVSSNRILTNDTANGVINFETAVKFIDSNVEPNVYVAFKNDGEECANIHLGVKMLEPYSFSDNFYSAKGLSFAKYSNGEIEFLNTKVEKCEKEFKLNLDLENMEVVDNQITKSGIYVKPFLGLNYNQLKEVKTDFVLHDLYHSGTANTQNFTEENNTNFLNFAEHCEKNDIPLYVCNIIKKDVNYESANLMLEKSVAPIYNILSNVALAKLIIAHNFLDKELINEYLNSSICGEIL